MDPSIKLDRFAQLCAEIECGAAQDDLLEREKVTPEEWASAREIWLGRMAEEAQQKRFVLTNRYNTAFNTKRRLLAAKRPSPAQSPAPAPPPPEVAVAPVAKPPPPPPPAAPVAIAHAAPAPMPSFSAPWPVAPMPPIPPPVSAPPVPAPPVPAPVAAKHLDIGGTVGVDDQAAFAEALPFLKAAREAYAAGRIPSSRAPSSPPPRDASLLNLPIASAGLTLGLDGSLNASEIMPFLKATAPTPSAAKPVSSQPTSGSSTNVGATVFLPSGLPQQNATPFRAAPAPSPAGRFTLEQFASLTAEVAVSPARIGEVRKRYSLDEASHRAEAEHWQTQFAREAGLFEKYAALVQRYRDWIERGGR